MNFARISANVCYAQVCLEEVCTQLNLSGESTMGRLADGRFEKVLSMLIHVWLQESWALDIRYALEARVDRKLETSVTSLQTFARSVAARYYVIAKKKTHYNGVHSRATAGAAIFIQTRLARGPAARARTVVMALRAFKKYAVDDNEMHQWHLFHTTGWPWLHLMLLGFCQSRE